MWLAQIWFCMRLYKCFIPQKKQQILFIKTFYVEFYLKVVLHDLTEDKEL